MYLLKTTKVVYDDYEMLISNSANLYSYWRCCR